MDENDSKSMGEVIGAAKAIQAAAGGVVLLVHHTGKDSTKGMRGHSSLLAALDAAIEVTRTDDRREWKIAKSKDGEDGEAHPFRLDVVEIGEDEDDGEPVTSCIVMCQKRARVMPCAEQPPKAVISASYGTRCRTFSKRPAIYGPRGAPATRPVPL
jgi:hypothetical protein